VQHGDLTSEEINEYVKYRGDKNSYYGYIYQLARRGFISKTNNKKPYIYSTTAKGREHAANPFINVQRRQEAAERKLQSLIENEESLQKLIEEAVSRRYQGGPVSGHGSISQPSESVNQEKYISEIKKKDDRIAQLETMIQSMKRSQASTGPGQVRQQTKSPEKIREDKIRIKRRRKLSEAYASRGAQLDYDFFKKFGLFPYKIKFQKYGASGSVEIFSKSNEELRRGHCHPRPLPPNAIMQCGFRIISMNEKGITVGSHVLPDGKARMNF
jgi:hypothetical protein